MEKENAEIEFETVPVRIPKAIMDLLRTFRKDVDEYLTVLIVDAVASVLGTELGHGGEIVCASNVLEKFGLRHVFEVFDCMSYMPKDC